MVPVGACAVALSEVSSDIFMAGMAYDVVAFWFLGVPAHARCGSTALDCILSFFGRPEVTGQPAPFCVRAKLPNHIVCLLKERYALIQKLKLKIIYTRGHPCE